MNELYGEYPVTASGQHVGTLSVLPNGLFTEFHCRCSYSSPEILRLFCVSDGNHIGIGVLVPGSGELTLRKKYSRNSLMTLGISGDITECYLSSSSSGEKKAEGPAQPMPKERIATPAESTAAITPTPAATAVDKHVTDIPTPAAAVDKYEAETPAPTAAAEKYIMDIPAQAAAVADKSVPDTPVSADSMKEEPRKIILPQTKTPAAEAQQPPQWESKIGAPFPQDSTISMPDRCEDDNSKRWPEAIPASDMTSSPKIPPDLGTPEMPPAWSVEHEPARLFYSPELASACRSVNGALTRREGGITLLAVPVSSDEPFPMLPVFCFGEPWIIGGRDYIVFRIKNGELFTE